MRALIIAFFVSSLVQGDAFMPLVPPAGHAVAGTSLMMAKRKVSMAEKRKRRQAKSRSTKADFTELPKSKLDFQSSEDTTASDDRPLKMSDPREAAEKAQELLQAQRASVDMLTMVRERVESLPSQDILDSLDTQKMFIVDNFLKDDSVISQLQAEAETLYGSDAMDVDMGNLGGGEYTLSLKGGSEQYAECPRLIEWVVSSTKHIPEAFPSYSLDASACMATLRTFDRKAFQASLALLTGSDDMKQSEREYGTVVNDESDKRSLSLCYFVVPEEWDDSCGGGLDFEDATIASAKRDRLVIWKSNDGAFRQIPWQGSDSVPIGSCVELHLVSTQ